MEILTEDLLNELRFTNSLQTVLDQTSPKTMSLCEYLNEMLVQKKLKKSVVIADSQLNETFAYQIFLGKRNPSRNKVLQLLFALKLNLKEGQMLLRCATVNELYCKNRRDAILIFCINNQLSLSETDDKLHSFGEETIVSPI